MIAVIAALSALSALVLILAGAAALRLAFSWVTALLGLIAKSAEAAAAASLPACSSRLRLQCVRSDEQMPAPLCLYADHQPLTATVNAVRSLLLGGPAGSHALAAVIWCLGITAVFAPLAVMQYRRAA